MRPLLILALLLPLAACGKPKEEAPTAPVAAATEATIPTDAMAAQPAYTVSDTGLGPITAGAPFDRNALAKLFPKAQVTNGTDNWEGMEYPIIDVKGEDGLDLRVNAGENDAKRVARVWARGGPVVGQRGERIGDGWAKGGFKTGECNAGWENDTGKIFCRRPGHEDVAYVYETGDRWEDGLGENEVPSAAFLEANGRITGLIWTQG